MERKSQSPDTQIRPDRNLNLNYLLNLLAIDAFANPHNALTIGHLVNKDNQQSEVKQEQK